MSSRALLFVALAACATQPTPSRKKPTYSFGGLAGYSSAEVFSHGVAGPSVAGFGVLRFGGVSVGIRASVASLDGTYRIPSRTVNVETMPVSAGLYVQGTAFDRLWGGLSSGVDFADIADDTAPSTFKIGFNVGVDAGVDVLRFGQHRLVLFGRAETEISSSSGYRALSVGAGYRLY